MKQSKIKTGIDSLKEEALKRLTSDYRYNERVNGKCYFPGPEKIGATATAHILLSFNDFTEGFSEKQRMEAGLLKSQIGGSGNYRTEGGWGYVVNHQGIATTEATCLALLALREGYASHPKVQAGLTWLIRNALRTERYQGWGFGPGDISRVYTTCLVLKTLKTFGKENTYEYRRGLNWLLNIQNDDDGWGSTAGAASDIKYTSRVVITLIEIGCHCNNESLQLAIQWLKKNTRNVLETKAHVNYVYDERIEYRNATIYFHHLPVQSTIAALVLSGDTKISARLYERMENYSKRKPLWAIFETMQLCEIMEKAINNGASQEVSQAKENRWRVKDWLPQFELKSLQPYFIQRKWGTILNSFSKLGIRTYLSRAVQ